MQSHLQYADPSADPHDAIAAQLRDLAPRIADDPAQLSIAPAASPELSREPTFHTEPLNDNIGDLLKSSHPKTSSRRLFMLTVCAGVLAAAVWYAYGDTARHQISHLIPQLRPAAFVPAQATSVETRDTTAQAQSSEPAVPSTASGTADAGTASSLPEAGAVPGQAQLPPEIAQSIESMKQEIASLRQTVEQLQTGQQQLGRDVAKINENEARRAATAKSTKSTPKRQAQPQQQRTVAAPAVISRPAAPYPPSAPPQVYSHVPVQRDTYAAPAAPAQLPPQPGDTSAPRPPMPLR